MADAPTEAVRQVTVSGLDGSELIATQLPSSSTVWDLQQLLAECTGTSALAQRLLLGNHILCSRATLEEAGVEDGACLTLVVTFEPVEYRVLQGQVIKRLGADPAHARKIVGCEKRVGSKVRTTGRLWTGPQGGEWVELDSSAASVAKLANPAWLLVEGPGFHLAGPLLERVCPGEEEPLVLSVRSPADDSELHQLCLRPSLHMGEVKQLIAWRFHSLQLEARNIVFVEAKKHMKCARFTPSNWLIADEVALRDTPFRDGDELLYLYIGDLEHA